MGVQVVAEVGVGDVGQGGCALANRTPAQLGHAVLGDDHVELVSRSGHDRTCGEHRDDAGDELAVDGGCRREAEQRPVLELEARSGDEVLVAADAGELPAADRVGDRPARTGRW